MIKLTIDSNGKPLYINPDLVQSVLPVDDSTRITVAHDVLFVTASPDEVTRKILEYKLAILGRPKSVFRDNKGEITVEADELYRLAGLEE